MQRMYSQNKNEVIFLCAYEMFLASSERVAVTNDCIQSFFPSDASDEANSTSIFTKIDKIGIYTCHEGPIYQLEMVQRDDPRQDMKRFLLKQPMSTTRTIHPYNMLVHCLN